MAITDLIVSGLETGDPQFTTTSLNWSVIAGAARTGSLGGRATGALGTAAYGQQSMTASGKVIVRFYWRYPSALPSGGSTGGAYICSIREGASGVFQCTYRLSDSVVYVGIGGGTVATSVYQFGPVINDLNWHLVELQADHSTATPTLDWKIDGVLQTQVVASGTATNMDAIRLGDGTSTGAPARTEDYDDIKVGQWTVAATDWYGGDSATPVTLTCAAASAATSGTQATVLTAAPLTVAAASATATGSCALGIVQQIRPASDIVTTGWLTEGGTAIPPGTAYDRLADQSDATFITATLA